MLSTPRPGRRTALVTAALLALVAAGAGGAALLSSGGHPRVSAAGKGAGGPDAPSTPAVVVTVKGLREGHLHYGRHVVLQASHGRIGDAAVTDGTGAPVSGAVSAAGAAWRSAGQLPPAMRYTAVVQTVAKDGTEGTVRLRFTTSTLGKHDQLTAKVSPDGGTYGVGMPVVAYFDHDIPAARRAAVEHRFTVRSGSHQVGAWHWMDARTAHWRPARLWTAHATVTVHWDLARLSLGHGVWGDLKPHATSFRTGNAHVTTVDAAGHYMAVRSGGELVRVVPVSTGRPEYASKGGAHIVLAREKVTVMDSATVGIPKDDPDYYYEKVYWDTRISNGGMFVHAAPWSVADQGLRNVSHGCVNVSTANAQWFYYFSQIGDVVNVVNTPARPLLWDAGTADWTISWREWLAADPAHPDLSPDIPTDRALLATVPVSHREPAPVTTTPAPVTTTPSRPHRATHSPTPAPTTSKRTPSPTPTTSRSPRH